jgi:hypothetical protein
VKQEDDEDDIVLIEDPSSLKYALLMALTCVNPIDLYLYRPSLMHKGEGQRKSNSQSPTKKK